MTARPQDPLQDAAIALRDQLAAALLAQELRLATAESCTGGLLAKTCTDLPGSSAWFDCAIVSYSNASKQRLLGVPADLIDAHGAVSEAVVLAMLQGLFARSDADLGIAVSGIAGPGGGSAEKPVGTVWFSVGLRQQPPRASLLQFPGERGAVREQALITSLKLLLASIKQ